jgi:hypothetical protein
VDNNAIIHMKKETFSAFLLVVVDPGKLDSSKETNMTDYKVKKGDYCVYAGGSVYQFSSDPKEARIFPTQAGATGAKTKVDKNVEAGDAKWAKKPVYKVIPATVTIEIEGVKESRQLENRLQFLSEDKGTVETYYFIFGEAAVESYQNEKFEEVLANLSGDKEGDWALATFKPSMDHPSSLLSEYDGWNGFAEISKEEYGQLLKLKG